MSDKAKFQVTANPAVTSYFKGAVQNDAVFQAVAPIQKKVVTHVKAEGQVKNISSIAFNTTALNDNVMNYIRLNGEITIVLTGNTIPPAGPNVGPPQVSPVGTPPYLCGVENILCGDMSVLNNMITSAQHHWGDTTLYDNQRSRLMNNLLFLTQFDDQVLKGMGINKMDMWNVLNVDKVAGSGNFSQEDMSTMFPSEATDMKVSGLTVPFNSVNGKKQYYPLPNRPGLEYSVSYVCKTPAGVVVPGFPTATAILPEYSPYTPIPIAGAPATISYSGAVNILTQTIKIRLSEDYISPFTYTKYRDGVGKLSSRQIARQKGYRGTFELDLQYIQKYMLKFACNNGFLLSTNVSLTDFSLELLSFNCPVPLPYLPQKVITQVNSSASTLPPPVQIIREQNLVSDTKKVRIIDTNTTVPNVYVLGGSLFGDNNIASLQQGMPANKNSNMCFVPFAFPRKSNGVIDLNAKVDTFLSIKINNNDNVLQDMRVYELLEVCLSAYNPKALSPELRDFLAYKKVREMPENNMYDTSFLPGGNILDLQGRINKFGSTVSVKRLNDGLDILILDMSKLNLGYIKSNVPKQILPMHTYSLDVPLITTEIEVTFDISRMEYDPNTGFNGWSSFPSDVFMNVVCDRLDYAVFDDINASGDIVSRPISFEFDNKVFNELNEKYTFDGLSSYEVVDVSTIYGGNLIGGGWFSNFWNAVKKIPSYLTDENVDKALNIAKKGLNVVRKADNLVSKVIPEYNDTAFARTLGDIDTRIKRIGLGKKGSKRAKTPKRKH